MTVQHFLSIIVRTTFIVYNTLYPVLTSIGRVIISSYWVTHFINSGYEISFW
jgi:argininosuccinate synthase